MADSRIKDLIEATATEEDDYLMIDGETYGTRKISASGVGGGKEYDVATTNTPSIDSRGVYSTNIYVYPNGGTLEIATAGEAELSKMRAYLLVPGKSAGYGRVYPLIITDVGISSSSYLSLHVKSIYNDVQSTSSSYIASGYVHVVAPFPIDSAVWGM